MKKAASFIILNNKFKIKAVLVIIICLSYQFTFGQNNRLVTKGDIGWYNYFGTFKFSSKFSLQTEYQWRRENYITEKQQSIVRLGVNYKLNQNVLFRIGYAWIETFPYGEIPLNVLGRDFTEHRIFEMVQLSHKEGKLDFAHRYMLEQRFLGRYSTSMMDKEDEFPLLNRMRYLIRVQLPLKGNEIKDKTPYLAAYNEVFIGFGKNVNANIFDQNRIGVLVGYRLNKSVQLEAGYLNQILQFGRQINGENVFQNNKGLIINANFNFNLIKNKI